MASEDGMVSWEDMLCVNSAKKAVLNGIYVKVPDKVVHGFPVWKHVDGDSHIYSLQCGQWALCEKDAHIESKKYFCSSAAHGGKPPYVGDVLKWSRRCDELRLRVLAGSSATWEDIIYIRSEECRAWTGSYRRIPSRTHRGCPIWHKAGDNQGYIYCGSGDRWFFTLTEAGIEEGRAVWGSMRHSLQSPTAHELYPWIHYRSRSSDGKLNNMKLTGTVLSGSPNPKLPVAWAEQLWGIQKELDVLVYVQQRSTMKERLDALAQSVAAVEQRCVDTSEKHLEKIEREQNRSIRLARALTTASFPDVELCIGTTRIPANREQLSERSPFFEAMLRENSAMQESISGQVVLPAGNADAVRALLCLMASSADDAVVDLLGCKLGAEQLLDVLAQADEWQCVNVAKQLLGKARAKLGTADSSTALPFLKLAALHVQEKDPKLRKEWLSIFNLASERFADSCAGNLAEMVQLPFEAMQRVLKQNVLDTGSREGQLLVVLARWVQSHGVDELPSLLEHVRFPLMRFSSLSDDEKSALRSLREQAGLQVQRLLGEAFALQTGSKRTFEDEESSSAADAKVKKARSTPRRNGAGIPVLNEAELGQVVCHAFL